jgi:hypothetical protein
MDTEFKIPAAVLLVAVAVILVLAVIAPGAGGALASLLSLLFITAVSVAVSLLALLIASEIAGISYGPVGTAALKLAAITLVPTAAGMLVPWPAVAWIVMLLSFLGLVTWLFDLDGRELLITIVVLIVTRVAIAALAATVVAAFTAAT